MWICFCICTSPPSAVRVVSKLPPALPSSVAVLALFGVQSTWIVDGCGLGAHRINTGWASPGVVSGAHVTAMSRLSGLSGPCCMVACGFRDLHIHVGCNFCSHDLLGCWRSLHSVTWRVMADSCFSLVVALTTDSHKQRKPNKLKKH